MTSRADRAVTPGTLGAWVIKCNPRVTPVEPMRAAGLANPDWCVADNYRTALIEPDQRVLFWVTSHPRRGIWGTGRVTGVPYLDAGRLHVPVRIPLFEEPVIATDLAAVPGLGALEVFRSPQQANPSYVSATELGLIEPLLPRLSVG